MADHAKKLAAAVQTLIPCATIAAELLDRLDMRDKAAKIKHSVVLSQKFLDAYRAENPEAEDQDTRPDSGGGHVR